MDDESKDNDKDTTMFGGHGLRLNLNTETADVITMNPTMGNNMMMNMNNMPLSIEDIGNIDPSQLTRCNVSLSQLIEAEVIEKFARDQNGSRFIQ